MLGAVLLYDRVRQWRSRRQPQPINLSQPSVELVPTGENAAHHLTHSIRSSSWGLPRRPSQKRTRTIPFVTRFTPRSKPVDPSQPAHHLVPIRESAAHQPPLAPRFRRELRLAGQQSAPDSSVGRSGGVSDLRTRTDLPRRRPPRGSRCERTPHPALELLTKWATTRTGDSSVPRIHAMKRREFGTPRENVGGRPTDDHARRLVPPHVHSGPPGSTDD